MAIRMSLRTGPALVASFIAGILIHGISIHHVLGRLPEDSFLTLSTGGKTGLIVISVTMLAVLFYICWMKTNALLNIFPGASPFLLLIDLVTTWIIFSLLLMLSVQGYYFYYLLLFSDLPLQLVIDPQEAFQSAAGFMISRNIDNLADLLTAVSMTALLLFTVLLHLRNLCISHERSA